MKALIQHLIRESLPAIAAASFLNCHVPGLHSIMFVDEPEQRIRLFIATAEHQLHLNTMQTLGSLAAHPHHCNITLHCIKGELANLKYEVGPATTWPGVDYVAYTYQSAILMGHGSFVRADAPSVAFHSFSRVLAGDSLALPAHVVHSVQVAQGHEAAWFVYEGREDADYSSLSFSNQPLENASFEGLYQPMDEANVLALLRSVDLL